MNLAKQRNNGANGVIYDAVEKWYAEDLAIDGSPFSGTKIDQPLEKGLGSTDHVWKKSNLADFFSSVLGSEFDCDDLNALFSSCGVSLQTLYNQLPSMDPANVQTGFAFMNRNLNGMKGWMFSKDSKILCSKESTIQMKKSYKVFSGRLLYLICSTPTTASS